MTIGDVVAGILGPYGTIFTLLLIIWAGYKRYWVWGWYAKELKDSNNELKKETQRTVSVAKNVSETAETAVQALTERRTEA